MSVLLFAAAEAIACRGLPEPQTVNVDKDTSMVITVASVADQDQWARALRFPAEELARPLHDYPERHRRVRCLEGPWHGGRVLLYYSTEEPAEVAA